MDTTGLLIKGRDGFYVRATYEAGAWWLCAGHCNVVGGLFGGWSDCESAHDLSCELVG